MKKRMLALLIVTTMAVSLVASCGNGNGSSEADSGGSTEYEAAENVSAEDTESSDTEIETDGDYDTQEEAASGTETEADGDYNTQEETASGTETETSEASDTQEEDASGTGIEMGEDSEWLTESLYVEGDEEENSDELGADWELLYGTVAIIDPEGNRIFEYEGEYKLDENECVLIYWEDEMRCEFYYNGCTIEATQE